MAFKLSENQNGVLLSLISEYVVERKKHFPYVKLRHKHHFMMHYPHLIFQFGPLRHLWTLRYESKHKYFKTLIKHIPNFKNILYLFFSRHQLLQAFLCTTSDTFHNRVNSNSQSYFNLYNFPRD